MKAKKSSKQVVKVIRPYGDIKLDLEKLWYECINDHGMQVGDLIFDVYGWAETHADNAFEKYTRDGSAPVLRYRHKDDHDDG